MAAGIAAFRRSYFFMAVWSPLGGFSSRLWPDLLSHRAGAEDHHLGAAFACAGHEEHFVRGIKGEAESFYVCGHFVVDHVAIEVDGKNGAIAAGGVEQRTAGIKNQGIRPAGSGDPQYL